MTLPLTYDHPLGQLASSDALLNLGVLALDAGLHDSGVAKDEDGGSTDQPEESAEGRRDPEHRDANDEEAGVERLLRDDVLADLDWVGRYLHVRSFGECVKGRRRAKGSDKV